MSCYGMVDPTLFVVGVPGMGNADPSWHQVLVVQIDVSAVPCAWLDLKILYNAFSIPTRTRTAVAFMSEYV